MRGTARVRELNAAAPGFNKFLACASGRLKAGRHAGAWGAKGQGATSAMGLCCAVTDDAEWAALCFGLRVGSGQGTDFGRVGQGKKAGRANGAGLRKRASSAASSSPSSAWTWFCSGPDATGRWSLETRGTRRAPWLRATPVVSETKPTSLLGHPWPVRILPLP